MIDGGRRPARDAIAPATAKAARIIPQRQVALRRAGAAAAFVPRSAALGPVPRPSGALPHTLC